MAASVTVSALSFVPVTSVPCTVCGQPSVRLTSWPDGSYLAACTEHVGTPQQIGLYVEVVS